MFSEDDLKRAAQFGQFLAKAELKLSVAEWLEFNRLLSWYNGVVKKIGDNILEVQKVIPPPPASEPKKGKK